MAFNGNNMTPLGGNARAGNNAQDRNAPMGWAYESATDDLATIQEVGYFDTFNAFLQAGQFIYVFSADGQKVFLLVGTVNKTLKQVTMDSQPIQPVKVPENVVFVAELADFPDPDSEVITLDPNISYELYDLINSGQNRIQLPEGVTNRILSTNPAINAFEYEGSATYITGLNVLNFTVETSFIRSLGEGAILFNLDAGINTSNSIFSAHRQVFVSWTSLGTIKGFALAAINAVDFEDSGPLVLDGNKRFFMTSTVIEPNTDPITLISIIGDNDVQGNIAEGEWTIRSNQAGIFIDPNIGVNSQIFIDMVAINLEAGGEFFKTGTIGNIVGFVNNTSNGNINNIESAESGNAILVTTTVPHNLEVFQEVAQTTGITAYDVPTSITSVPQADQYILPIPFSIGQSGTYIANSVTVATSAPHGLSDGQTLLIEGEPDYNGGARIYLAAGTGFNINRPFAGVGSSSGTFNTGSLTQKDPRVNISQVSGVPDSKTIFNFSIIGNTQPTNIIGGDLFQDIDFSGGSGAIITSGTELFTLIDPDNGEYRYEGLEDISIILTGFVAGESSIATARVFNFVPAINNISQQSNIAPSTMNITNTKETASFAGVANLSQGDTIKMQILEEVNSEAFTAQDFAFIGKV